MKIRGLKNLLFTLPFPIAAYILLAKYCDHPDPIFWAMVLMQVGVRVEDV